MFAPFFVDRRSQDAIWRWVGTRVPLVYQHV